MRKKIVSAFLQVTLLLNLVSLPASARPLNAPAAQALSTMHNQALVLVNQASASYPDFGRYILPYLKHFGVPYEVLDISTANIPATLQSDYGLVIIGHRGLDTGGTYLSQAEQDLLSVGVNSGMGLVNFDNDLFTSGTPRYDYIHDIFNFGSVGAASASGVTFTPLSGSPAYTIDLTADANQDPDLATTTDPLALVDHDNQWTEYFWDARGYPAVFGGYDETLPLMHFSGAVPDGEYTLSASLYWSHNLRYYWGYTAGAPQDYSLDVTSGISGEFSNYTLGTVTVDNGQFDLYVENADPLEGGVDYGFFGWAWVSLTPTGAPPGQMHYITSQHEANSSISTGSMTMAGVSLPARVTALATSGTQPLVAVTSYGQGRAVQFGSYNWMSNAVKGPMYGLDDLVWRSIVWAARKPFVLQAMLPFLTMRMDDESGPFTWIHIANEFGIKPWAGLFYHYVDDTEAADLSQLVNSGNATATVHAKNGLFFYYNHDIGDFDDPTVAANYAEATAWFQQHNIPLSEFVVPHYYEFGTNIFQGLSDWGVKYVGTQMEPGNGYDAPWIMNGPFRLYETGSSSGGVPLYYADFMTIPGHPEFENDFFNCVTEIRDDAGYEWYPSDDVALSIGRGTRQTKRALDALGLATLFSHGYYPADITSDNWRAILQGITNNLAPYHVINVTMEDACAFARAIHISKVSTVAYDPDLRRVEATLLPETGWQGVDIPTKLYLFTGQGDDITHVYMDVPAFTGSTTVGYTLAGPLASIVVSPATATAALGSTVQFTAQGFDAQHNSIPNLPFTWRVINGPGTINANGLFSAGLAVGAATVQAEYGGITGRGSVNVVAPLLDHFTIDAPTTAQYVGAPFPITVSARDISGNLLVGYSGPAALVDSTGTLSPAVTGTFSGGQWTGNVAITTPANNVTITVSDGAASTTSAPFNVLAIPAFFTVTSPVYSYLRNEVFPVTVTAYAGTQINLAEDNHQQPVLAQTSSMPTLENATDGLWTEFYYPSSRPYATIMAPANEFENNVGLPVMRFYAAGIPDGPYQVIANLYQNSPMRYFYGLTPGAPKALSIDTPGGAEGTQHAEFNLGTFEVTGNTFNLYVQDADLISGTYPIFGWAWIRLVPAAASESVINLAEDNHQDPALPTITTTDWISVVDNQWTEFLYTSSRPYPSIMALHNETLPLMRFYTSGLANGTYAVEANLYDVSAMRYYYGFTPGAPLAQHVDVPGGAAGTQHRYYPLGQVTITDGSFSLYVQDADLISGTNNLFGWAHIRLVPVGVGMTSSSAGMRFDADGDGIFGEPGDEVKALVDNTFTINARGAAAGAGITITAADMLGRSGFNTYEIVNHNQPPTASSQSETTLEDTPVSFTLNAADPDSSPLTYSIGAPSHGSLSGTAPNLTYTPHSNWSGADSFSYTASDGEFTTGAVTVSITVGGVNDAPVLGAIGNQSAAEGALLTFTAAASDVDTALLTFSLSSAPAGASINPTTGVFTWTPTEAQGPHSYSFAVCVSDGALSDCETITAAVSEVNTAPVLGAIGGKSAAEGTLLTFTASATDADLPANGLTFSLSSAPGGASIDPASGVFTWTPTEAQGPHSYTFAVCVSDGALSDCETITAAVSEVNTAPVLGAIGGKSAAEGTLLTFTAAAADADLPANGLTFSLSAPPSGASIDPASGVFTWTPTEAQGPHSYTFAVCVSDGALSDCETITAAVSEVNTAPVLGAIGDKSAPEGTLLTFTAAATDADLPANGLTFSLSSAPDGASIDPASGVFTWTPTEAQGPGSYTFAVWVTDDSSPALHDMELITITVSEVNVAPVLGAIGHKAVYEKTLLTFTAAATDADLPPNTLVYSLVGAPAGAAITMDGVFTWTPAEAQGPGSYTFDVVVSDGELSDFETITVTIQSYILFLPIVMY